MTIGVVHPGEMGAAVGAALVARGVAVAWSSEGRSEATAGRARAGGLVDAGSLTGLAARCDTIVSVCPPHAALDTARQVMAAGFRGRYVDANAVAPATAGEVARVVTAAGGRFVDGGIIGPPPRPGRPVHLWLSGPGAEEVAGLFEGTTVQAAVVGPDDTSASALKMCFAAWTKGSSALLLAVRALARRSGVEGALLGEWAASSPGLLDQSRAAATQAAAKGWRWAGEMDEIAATFRAADLPPGFHEAAAALYASVGRDPSATGDAALERVLAALLRATGPAAG